MPRSSVREHPVTWAPTVHKSEGHTKTWTLAAPGCCWCVRHRAWRWLALCRTAFFGVVKAFVIWIDVSLLCIHLPEDLAICVSCVGRRKKIGQVLFAASSQTLRPTSPCRPQHLFPWPRRAGPNVERCPHGLVLQLQASSLELVTKISPFIWRDQCGNRSWRCRSKTIFSLFFANMFPRALSLLPRHVRVSQRRTLHVQRCSKVRVVTNR